MKNSKVKNIMWGLIIIIAIAVIIVACGSGSAPKVSDYDLSSADGIRDYTEAVFENEALVNLQSVTVNDHAGGGHEGEFILLVNLEFKNENDADQTRKTCQGISDPFVTSLESDSPDVSECVFFYDTPLGDLKIQYEKGSDGKFFISDMPSAF